MNEHKQPEALRLADTTPSLRGGDWSDKAADELRRLHSEVEQLRGFLKEIYYQKSMNS